MFRSLAFNTAVSAAAYILISIVGLLLVPVLISSYGLSGFGLIVMARLFLPVAALATLDFGGGEIATQVVSRARADNDWQRCARVLTLVVAATALAGLLAGALLVALAPFVPGWMSVPPASQEGLRGVLSVTGLLLPLFFVSLVLEGIVKGFEDFVALRSVEVGTALAYAGPTLAMVWAGWPLEGVCYAFLVSIALRALIAASIVWHALRAQGARPSRWDDRDRAEFAIGARVMWFNKLLGAAQAQGGPLLIGLLLNPAALGLFDALTRLPRFAKAATGLLSSAVLPVAVRLDRHADKTHLHRLGQTGLLMISIVTLPPLAAAMTFSEPILRLWIGAEVAPMWAWQAAMFIVPALGTLVGFGSTTLMVRPHAVGAMNRLILLQIVIQFALSVIILGQLGARAFILGQVAAVALTFFAQMRLLATEFGTTAAGVAQLVRLGVMLLALGAGVGVLAPAVASWPALLLTITAWIGVAWALSLYVVLSAAQRAKVRSLWPRGRQ